jgi:hypothetical protein
MALDPQLAPVKSLHVIEGGLVPTGTPSRGLALVLHSDPAKREVIRETVSREFETVERTTPEDALGLLSGGNVSLVIADASYCGKPLLEGVAKAGLSGRCVFLSSPDSVNRLIDGFSRGHAFGIVYDSEDLHYLRSQIAQIVHPRVSTRHAASGILLHTEVKGGSLRCPVLDISNSGCAIRMRALPDQKPLLPGEFLSGIRLTRDDVTVLEGTSGVVRHLEFQRDAADGIGFVVGIEFVRPENPAESPAEESVLNDRVIIAASLKAALRPQDAGLQLNMPGFEGERIQAVGSSAELDGASLRLSVDRIPDWEPGDVCRAVFELGGTQHVFWSSVIDVAVDKDEPTLNLTMPRALITRRCRHTQRFRPPRDQAVFISLTSPFHAREIEAKVIDITASGAAFQIDGSRHLLPVGSLLPQITLSFPHGAEFNGRAQVRSLQQLKSTNGANLKCGVEFIDLNLVQRAELADDIVRCVRPEVCSGLESGFEDIWNFLKVSGFLYPEKLKHLNEEQIRQSVSQLLERPNDVFKTWLCKSEGQIVAHISAIRLFDSTWGVQHLAATHHREGVSRARVLNMALTEYCEQHPEIEWVRICYRPTNQWPARVFGSYAQKMVDRELSELSTLSYLVAPVGNSSDESEYRGITIRPLAPEDLVALEAYFVSRRQSIQLRSADISKEGIFLEQVNRAYERLGLYRERKVIVGERSGELVGFVLAEMSSPGLNFSELTNAASIHLLQNDPVVLRSLAGAARALYGQAGRKECIVLADEDLVPSLLDYGFTKQKEYCRWTWHRSLWRRFYEHSVRAFS